MSRKIADGKIVDVRVSVPSRYTVIEVLAWDTDLNIQGQFQCQIIDQQPAGGLAPMEEPSIPRIERKFVAGKTYRTSDGTTAQVLNDHGPGVARPYRISLGGEISWADNGGRYWIVVGGMTGEVVRTMLPGALEDEGLGFLQRQVSNLIPQLLEERDLRRKLAARVTELERWQQDIRSGKIGVVLVDRSKL